MVNLNSILIVEDDTMFSKLLEVWFTKKKYSVNTAKSVTDAKRKIKISVPDAVICDLRLPKQDGITLLSWIKSKYPSVVVIMMTGYADVQSAVRSIKLGAYDYISKPFSPTELFEKLKEAFHSSDKKNKKTNQKEEKINNAKGKYIKGKSSAYEQLYKHLELVAPTDMSVLITGESGVGKEHIAREIHQKSNRKNEPFIAVDCGVLSKELAGSDLFGHIKGAFTGALTNKIGAFVSANKGTIFLDEIGNLALDVQVRLLRALQEKKIKPVGSDKEIDIDVRIITATNEDIDFAVENGYFRMDLYHRISEFILEIPALRDIKEDIPLFLNHFLEISNLTLQKKVEAFEPEVVELLTHYDWPGNIREMKNIVNRLTLLSTSNKIEKENIPSNFLKKRELNTENELLDEKQQIENALNITQNNYIKTAALLNMDTKQLFLKIKKYNIANA